VHTYYALLMKLLATEVIVAQGGLGTPSSAAHSNQSALAARRTGIWGNPPTPQHSKRHRAGLLRVVYRSVDARGANRALRMSETLSSYDVGTFELKPERARDLLKDSITGSSRKPSAMHLGILYARLACGAHNRARRIRRRPPQGAPRSICGSGTFLLMAIQKIRQWLSDRTVEWGSTEKKREAVNLIRRNIVGFDLNPSP